MMARSFFCPHCGALVPAGAQVCPECGSDHQTGWSAPADDLIADDRLAPASAPQPWQKSFGVKVVVVLLIVALLSPLLGLPGTVGALVVAAIGAGFLHWQQRSPGPAPLSEDALYRDLVLRARGDSGLVDHLIDTEAERNPRASRRQVLEAVRYRMGR